MDLFVKCIRSFPSLFFFLQCLPHPGGEGLHFAFEPAPPLVVSTQPVFRIFQRTVGLFLDFVLLFEPIQVSNQRLVIWVLLEIFFVPLDLGIDLFKIFFRLRCGSCLCFRFDHVDVACCISRAGPIEGPVEVCIHFSKLLNFR